jgi:urease accessory protein
MTATPIPFKDVLNVAPLPALPILTAWQAKLALRFAVQAERTALVHNAHSGPLRVQKALYPEAINPHICHAVIVHPPAGVAGGDVLSIDLTLEANAHALITTPGATQWYKSATATPASMAVALRLDAHAKLDWLPQENILFDRSQVQLHTVIDLHPSASAIGWDVCMLGRSAAGERWQQAALQQRNTLTRGGKVLWVEHSDISSELSDNDVNSQLRHNAAALAGHSIMGTLWAVGECANSEQAQAFAAALPYTDALKTGITFLQDNHYSGGVILLRVLGKDMESVRRCMVAAWLHFRPLIHGVEAVPLRLWAM